jgi:hypothetical protein
LPKTIAEIVRKDEEIKADLHRPLPWAGGGA